MPTPALPPPISYDDAWIGGIIPGVLTAEGTLPQTTGQHAPGWLPAPALEATTIVLFVLDGLGWTQLQANPTSAPNLAGMEGLAISSAFPSTTATGLTSITTGAPPSQHGITGYAMRVGGKVMSALQWRYVGGGGKAPHPDTVQTQPVFGGHRVPVVTKADFKRTGFSQAHLGDGEFHGWQTPAVMVEQLRALVRQQPPLVYTYYDGIDKVAHAHGLDNPIYRAELAETDRLVGLVRDALPPDAALLVTADHGQVDIPSEHMRTLDGVKRMVTAYSGEGRARGLFARAGAFKDLHDACIEQYGDVAWVMTREEVFEGGWFGPGASPTVRSRCGDVMLIAREPVAFLAPNFPMEAELRTMHGSLTPDEVLVPLLATRGTAAA